MWALRGTVFPSHPQMYFLWSYRITFATLFALSILILCMPLLQPDKCFHFSDKHFTSRKDKGSVIIFLHTSRSQGTVTKFSTQYFSPKPLELFTLTLVRTESFNAKFQLVGVSAGVKELCSTEPILFCTIWKRTPHSYECIPSQYKGVQTATEHIIPNLCSQGCCFELVLVKILSSDEIQTWGWVSPYSLLIVLYI